MMAPINSPTLDTFLIETNKILATRNSSQLQSYLQIEPPFNNVYHSMISEIRLMYAKGNEDALEAKCARVLVETKEDPLDGSSWTPFVKFITTYLFFLRDVNVDDLMVTYQMLSELQQKANSALTHATKGIIVLPTVIAYAKVFARLAIGLEERPELILHLRRLPPGEEEGARETLPEKAANILRQAFVTCLNDRNTTTSGIRDGKPDGKKIGIYKMANICLKILFQCDKIENGEQIFANIMNSSPPLSIYPASERVTYLYYLGRFHFSFNHHFAAQVALQKAYDDCPADSSCQHQRRLILIYLVAANLVLGRFPSEHLYSRPEAVGFRELFGPICRAIANGDLASFRRLFDSKHERAGWFRFFGIFFQLGNRCEVHLWRSLFRKTFLLGGEQGNSTVRKAPTLDLYKVLAVFVSLEKRASMPLAQLDAGPGKRHTNWIFMSRDLPPEAGYIDPEFEGLGIKPQVHLPSILEIESMCSSLIVQGLMNGYISHKLKRFAILGQKKGGALAAGFPNPWQVIKERVSNECPGWKMDMPMDTAGRTGHYGPGMVVNLQDVKPVGASPFRP